MIADIGIDLGTSSIVVYVKNKGVVLKEPSLMAFARDTNELKEIGEDAKVALNQSTGDLVAVRPLQNGVITDYRVAERLIRFFVQKSLGKLIFKKPRLNVSIPSTTTEVERRAVFEAAKAIGAREVTLVEEPIAAAVGAGIDISKASGNMVVDIGGGITDIAVISLGGIVVKGSTKVAGNEFDAAIVNYVRRKYDALIGDSIAEDIKIKIGTAYHDMTEETTEISGRDIATGIPKKITLSSVEMAEALKEPISQIMEAIAKVLEETTPELATDILERGMLLSGGGSLIRGLDRIIEKEIGIRAVLVPDPLKSVVIGTGSYV